VAAIATAATTIADRRMPGLLQVEGPHHTPGTLDRVIFDATDSTFEQDVIVRSRELPVVVDFWATWCGPCRTLGPVLEQAVTAREGKMALAKIDTDANQQVARAFQIQSIPAVKAFKDGKVVSEFIGAQPPAAVQRFLDDLLPSEADALIEAGGEDDLRRALELEPSRADAGIALARLLADRGEREAALAVLGEFPGSFAAEGLAARLRLEDDAELRDAFAALDAEQDERGLDALIAAIAGSADATRKDDLRRVVVGRLDALGVDHPVARESRRKLASALY
jgi:putative thioredoxin